MLPQSYIRSMITKIRVLFVINIIIALASAGVGFWMIWAIVVKPAWPFAVILLMAMVAVDAARYQAVNLLRQRTFWKKFLP